MITGIFLLLPLLQLWWYLLKQAWFGNCSRSPRVLLPSSVSGFFYLPTANTKIDGERLAAIQCTDIICRDFIIFYVKNFILDRHEFFFAFLAYSWNEKNSSGGRLKICTSKNCYYLPNYECQVICRRSNLSFKIVLIALTLWSFLIIFL